MQYFSLDYHRHNSSLTLTFALVEGTWFPWLFHEFTLEIKLLSWNVEPRLDGCRGSNGKEFDKLEYVFPALTGLFNDPLDNPLPIGDERGVP